MWSSTFFPLQVLLSSTTGISDYAHSPLVYPSRKFVHIGTFPFIDKQGILTTHFKASGKGSGAWSDAYTRAKDLVGQMRLEERANITRGFTVSDNVCAGNTGTVPRLGWPGLCLHDAGNGVRATDFVTSFPSALHVGASWDRNLTYQRGLYMGKEFKAKGGKTSSSCFHHCVHQYRLMLT